MNIIKHKNYYYLAHSFRKEGEVVHREKYLGKKIPKNIEDIKEKFMHECMEESAIKKLNSIKKNFLKEWKTYPESVKKEQLIDLSINFTYNTNAIEGSTITLHETEDIIKRKIAPNKPLRDVQETINHSKVFFEVLNTKKELSVKDFLQWHKKIFSDTKPDIAGKFRDYLVRVGDYRAPDWQDIDKLIKEFFMWYNTHENQRFSGPRKSKRFSRENKKIIYPVELAARAHYRFEKIHPFGDGNGRVGRLIIAHILRKNNFPLFIIEHKKRKAYYRALKKTENDFVNYCIRAYIRAHKKYL